MEVFLHPNILQTHCSKYLLTGNFGSGSRRLKKDMLSILMDQNIAGLNPARMKNIFVGNYKPVLIFKE